MRVRVRGRVVPGRLEREAAVVGGEGDGLAPLQVSEAIEQRGAPPLEVERLERRGLELRGHLVR